MTRLSMPLLTANWWQGTLLAAGAAVLALVLFGRLPGNDIWAATLN